MFLCLGQINGVDVSGLSHSQAVAMLTGHERFVRLVVEREVPAVVGTLSPNSGDSPRLFGLPRPYSGLSTPYSPNSYMVNRPGYRSPKLSLSRDPPKPNGVATSPPEAAHTALTTNGPVPREPPQPAPRRLTKSDSNESQDKTETFQVTYCFFRIF